jgi:hypothetical protein
MKAYTYSIKHIPTDTIYYGVRKSSVFDLGQTYFSSSKLIKRLINEHGIENFEFKQRRTFEEYEQARLHETKVLKRINAVSNPKVLNQAVSSPRICSKDSVSEKKRRESISNSMKGNKNFPKLTKEEHSRRGKLGAQKRAENIKSGITVIKRKSSDFITNWVMEKNGKEKIVKPSAVPAYLKCGYQKVRKIKILK